MSPKGGGLFPHRLRHDPRRGHGGGGPLLEQYGAQRLAPGVEMVVVLDHFVPAATLAQAQSHRTARAFVQKWGVEHFYEIGRAASATRSCWSGATPGPAGCWRPPTPT